eukprot:TRINITY_DN2438_c0_g2_i1.p1 TRINITY_DN2438_c0_g2~~TRINITY_DN2438_c0_g2_i1.p1  ORF type:complete len:655 (+),score=207.88 TRINITY_DN2438_c0_g2_i1:83-2047(+)
MNILQQSETSGFSYRLQDLRNQVNNGDITTNQMFEQLMERVENMKRNQAVKTPPLKKNSNISNSNGMNSNKTRLSDNNINLSPISSSHLEYDNEFDDFDDFNDLPIPNEPPPLPPKDQKTSLITTDEIKLKYLRNFDENYPENDHMEMDHVLTNNSYSDEENQEETTHPINSTGKFHGLRSYSSYLRTEGEIILNENTPKVPQTRRLATRALEHKKRFDRTLKNDEEKFRNTYTFQPKINDSIESQENSSRSRSRSKEAVHDRLYRLAAKKNEELNLKRRIKELNDIQADERLIQQNKTKKLSKSEESKMINRLYAKSKESQLVNSPFYNEEYAFKPKINENSRHIRSKFMDTVESKRLLNDDLTYTFQPIINEAETENNPCLRGYLKQSAFDRLSKNSNTLKKAVTSSISQIIDEDDEFEQKRMKKSLNQDDWDAFLSRQTQLLKDQERTRFTKQFETQQDVSYVPEITEMAKNVNNDLPVHERLFSQSQNNNFIDVKDSFDEANCTFIPIINENSRKLADTLSMNDTDLYDRGKLQQLKKQEFKHTFEMELSQNMPFEPNLNNTRSKYDNVKPTIKLDQDVREYIFELNVKERLKKDLLNRKKQEVVNKEVEQCTFRPKIHEAPEYVVDVVRELLQKRGPKTPLRTEKEWRS